MNKVLLAVSRGIPRKDMEKVLALVGTMSCKLDFDRDDVMGDKTTVGVVFP